MSETNTTRVVSTPAPASPEPSGGANEQFLSRWRYVAVALGLIALAFTQNPGRIAADTKLDLLVDPGGLMSRSFTLWEPLGFFGQLQNQGYGYLFPMGPFFWFFDLLGMPGWVAQRMWWSVLLVVAFAGAARVIQALGIPTFTPVAIGALSYALAPRMMTELTVLSAEVVPFALAPWVLLPLIYLTRGGSIRRAATFSGLAVFAVGGVNAVATIAVLPLAAWWIVYRFTGRARLVLGGWWVGAVALATAWWVIPLLLLGRYSPPFLDWIESASVTTAITAPDTALRGTSAWVAYVSELGGPVWPAGWVMVTTPLLIVISGITVVVGVVGVALHRNPYRVYLLSAVFAGLVLVTMGHLGPLQGFGSDTLHSLLDAALSPLRNTHKFDLILRLPLAIGVAYAVHRLMLARVGYPRLAKVAIVAVLVLVVSGATALVSGTSTLNRSFVEIPTYWQQAATWLEDRSDSGRALVVPGASFAVFSWGRTNDEPLQALGGSPWVVRDAVPLANAGAIRYLDAVNAQIDSGRDIAGLSTALARAGIEWVVLRNDIDVRQTGVPRTARVRQTLTSSPGLALVTSFGPIATLPNSDTLVVDRSLSNEVPPIEVWRVLPSPAQPDPRFALRAAEEVYVMSGSSEALADLADTEQLKDRVIVFAGDEQPLVDLNTPPTLRFGVTDSFQRSVVNFGLSRDNRSEVLSADTPLPVNRPVNDYLPVDPAGRQSVAEYINGTVQASSSASMGNNATVLHRENQAWSAIDGDDQTWWASAIVDFSKDEALGQWWQAQWAEPVFVDGVDIRLPPNAAEEGQYTITVGTDAGEAVSTIPAGAGWTRLATVAGLSKSLRITLDGVTGTAVPAQFGLAGVDLPVPIDRFVRTSGVVDGGPMVFRAEQGSRSGCLSVRGLVTCAPDLARFGAERSGIRRLVDVAAPGEYRIAMTLRPRIGDGLNRLLDGADIGDITAQASSTLTLDSGVAARSLVDGSQETAWIAGADDRQPEVTLTWDEPIRVSGIRLGLSPQLPASRPLSVTAIVNGLPTTVVANADGVVRFPAQETNSITLVFVNNLARRTLDPLTANVEILPVGVSEIGLIGRDSLERGPTPGDVISVDCVNGPTVEIDGVVKARSEVSVTYGQVLAEARVPARLCGGRTVLLERGEHAIVVDSTAEFVVDSVVLTPVTDIGIPAATGAAAVTSWEPASRSLVVNAQAEPRVLELNENANPGWVATINEEPLTALRVDGWRQAWWIPAGVGGVVSVEFAPDTTFRAGLIAGAMAVLALVALCAIPIRRRCAPVVVPVRPWEDWLLAGVGVVAAGLLAGFAGVVVSGVTMAIVWSYRLRRSRIGLIVAALGAATVLASMWAWPQRASAPAWVEITLTLLTVLGLAAAAAPWRCRADESTAEPDAPAQTTTQLPPAR